MIHSVRFTAVLDTNVIYPVITRDLLFWFAHYEMYTPKWSKHIFDEWIDVMLRRGLSSEESGKRVRKATLAFPDALVEQYEGLIEVLNLPDMKDRHVLAAAIKTNADLIVSNNIKDFPENILNSFGIKIKTADAFLTDLIDLNSETAIEAFKEMVLNKKKPDLDEYEVLKQLRKNGLTDTAAYLHSLL
ncbi:MAG: PIN domain-containing protein [Bacteroidales bacterium]